MGVCFHELGHAIGCALSGGKVDHIQLGVRFAVKPPLTFRFLGFKWNIYGFPRSGCVFGSFHTKNRYRLRQCLFIAAGPLATAILVAVGILGIYLADPVYRVPIFIGLTPANVVLIVFSVIPMTYRHTGTATPNDAALFFQTLAYTDAEIDHLMATTAMYSRLGVDAFAPPYMTLPDLFAQYRAKPDDLAVQWYLLSKLQETNDSRHFDVLLRFIEAPQLPSNYIAVLIDTALTAQLSRGPSDRPEVEEKLSRQLLELKDDNSTQGTRGSVLIDIGRIEEGKALLEEVLANAQSKVEKTYSTIFLALVAKAEGDLAQAREYAATARKLDPSCPALKRVTNLLGRGDSQRRFSR